MKDDEEFSDEAWSRELEQRRIEYEQESLPVIEEEQDVKKSGSDIDVYLNKTGVIEQ